MAINKENLETKIESLAISFEDGSEVIKLFDYDFKHEHHYKNITYTEGFFAFSDDQIIVFLLDKTTKNYFPITEDELLFEELLTILFQMMYFEEDFNDFLHQLFTYYDAEFIYEFSYQKYLDSLVGI